MSNPLDHPIYSQTESEWHSIEDLSTLGDSALADMIIAERTRITDYCTSIFGTFIQPAVIGAKSLVPTEILIKPMENKNRGFVSYVEFVFPSSERDDSDSWWMIVGCPDTTKTVFSEIKYNAWSFGWVCQ